ncbi:MAG: siderophore-interacting protein [Humibacillus sp.]|nr:siderophore-interacting protein [Humibacillus sp.]MDN5776927.1 siderophore-interacting protein [Humibacillus sp.]
MTTTTDTTADAPDAPDKTDAAPSPILLLTGVVCEVERLSPSFVRIWLGGEGFEQVGPEGTTLDQRIKIVIPNDGHPVPSSVIEADDWYAAWLALPEIERGHLRTYTARFVTGEGVDRRLVVDFVLHGSGGQGRGGSGGPCGPAATWAAGARLGDTLGVLAPRRGHEDGFGGIEFAPGDAHRLLFCADETALPAVASILESLPVDAEGVAVIEVPAAADFLDVVIPPGVAVHWIARGERPRGQTSIETLRTHCGLGAARDRAAHSVADTVGAEPGDDVWETPVFSSSGETLDCPERRAEPVGADDTYAWVAGDSATVKTIRRMLVGELGMPRRQVAFMGYWKDEDATR